MTIKAKPILKDRFWILEENGSPFGTISRDDDQFIISHRSKIEFCNDTTEIQLKFGAQLEWSSQEKIETEKSDFLVNGYPCSVYPFNKLYNIKKKLPLFTKSEKSKSLYCAGYYIIRFEKGWVKSFCPKLITVERYEHKGPYKTEFEMKQELSRANQ